MKKYNKAHVAQLVEGTADFQKLFAPKLAEMSDLFKGKSVVDIGCGSGIYTRYIGKYAERVFGVDQNQNQISKAVELNRLEDGEITYILGRFEDVQSELINFDIAIMMYVLLDIDSIRKISELASSISEALNHGGALIIGDVHPHNLNKKNASEHFQTASGDYFNNGERGWSDTRLESGKQLRFSPNYHYRLDEIVNTFGTHGLLTQYMYEMSMEENFPTHVLYVMRKV